MTTLSVSWGEMVDSYTVSDEAVGRATRRSNGRGQRVVANRVRLPSAAVERIVTWRHHRSSRGWRPMMEISTVPSYSEDAESLVYLVNAEIIVRPPSLTAVREHWGEAVDASEPEPVLVAAQGAWREPAVDASELEPAVLAAQGHVMVGAGARAFSVPSGPEPRKPATWSARALPGRTRADAVEPPSSSSDLQQTLSARKTFPVRTWAAHVPPASAT